MPLWVKEGMWAEARLPENLAMVRQTLANLALLIMLLQECRQEVSLAARTVCRALVRHRLKIIISVCDLVRFMRLKACFLFFIARSHSAFHHETDNFSEYFVWGMDAVAASRMLVSHNWYDCSNSVDIDGSDKSHKSLKRCQFALWKFQRGMWVLVGGSEPRIAIWTIEWSLPINSLWTVALHLEATSAEMIDKYKTLHSYRPLRK